MKNSADNQSRITGNHGPVAILCGIGVVVFALSATACGPSISSTSKPYLQRIGPAPLRFSEPKPPQVFFTNSAPAAVAKNESGPADADVPDFLAPPTSLNPAEIGQAVTYTAKSAPVSQPSQPAEVVSPQMLLKYFNKSTNGSVTGVVMPVEFAAPQPSAAPPSSSATYSTTPKQ
jgi:hypothetical protein